MAQGKAQGTMEEAKGKADGLAGQVKAKASAALDSAKATTPPSPSPAHPRPVPLARFAVAIVCYCSISSRLQFQLPFERHVSAQSGQCHAICQNLSGPAGRSHTFCWSAVAACQGRRMYTLETAFILKSILIDAGDSEGSHG